MGGDVEFMRVLVTGAYGNLGKHICTLARKRGFVVVPVGREEFSNIGDLVSTADAVIHAAGNIKDDFVKSPQNFVYDNLGVTADLLEACKPPSIRRFIFISSCAVYGHSATSQENEQVVPVNLNGNFKSLSEKMVTSYCLEHSIVFSNLRLFNLYGGADEFSIVERLMRSVIDGKELKLKNNGKSSRDFIHVEDAAGIILRTLSLKHVPSIINVGTGGATKIKKLVEYVSQNFGEVNIQNTIEEEVEYSKADITLLKELHSDLYFRCIFSYMREKLSREYHESDDKT
jgi:nucleoside-diphosphate-sugar epimerase